MAISLTSSGLYLEPRVYVNDGSGNNYGTPRLVLGDEDISKPLGGGTWTGLTYAYYSSYEEVQARIRENVTNSNGGGIYFRVS